jgi:hypothetical protein
MQATVQQGNWQKPWGLLVAKAWSDDALKQRLLDDPAAVLEEHGIEVPPGVELRVVEDTDQVCHLVLPASPSGDLVDEELTLSTGFYCYSGVCGACGRCGCGCGRCGCF